MHRVLHDGNAVQVIGMCHAVPGHVSTQHPGHVKQQNIGNKNSSIPPADSLKTVHSLNDIATTRLDVLHQNQSTPSPDNEIIVIPTSPIRPPPKVPNDRSEKNPTLSYGLTGECSDKNGQGSTDSPNPHHGDESVISCGDQSDSQTEPVNYIKGDHPIFGYQASQKYHQIVQVYCKKFRT